MRILVTGASGFAGSHLIEALREAGHTEIFGTVFGGTDFVKTLIPEHNIFAVNLTDKAEVDKLMQDVQPDWVFHLAAIAAVAKSFEKGTEVLHNNIILQMNILESIRQYAPKARVLIVGSAEEYGVSQDGELPITESHPFRPINPYAVSKIAQDLLAYSYFVSYKLNVIRVRPFNHIGERQTEDFAVAAFAKQMVEIEKGTRPSLQVGNLTGIRDFTDVKDMMKAYILLMEKGQVGEVYNIGSGIGTSMQTIVDKLAALSTAKVNIEQDPSRMRPHDIPEMVADASKMKSLGWSAAIPLDATLKRVLEYWRTK